MGCILYAQWSDIGCHCFKVAIALLAPVSGLRVPGAPRLSGKRPGASLETEMFSDTLSLSGKRSGTKALKYSA